MSNRARSQLISSANAVCETVQSTLGPFGANKLIVQSNGSVTTTAIGSLVLDQLDIEEPAVTLLQQASSDINEQYSNGTTQVMLLTGSLLKTSEKLIELGLHPTMIERGYYSGLETAVQTLDSNRYRLSDVGADAVAKTALTSVWDPQIRQRVGSLVEQITNSLVDRHGERAFEHNRVGVIARTGGSMAESELLRGVVLDKDPVVESMPRQVTDGGIALLSSTIDVETIGSPVDRSSGIDLTMELETFGEEVAIGEYEREAFQKELSAAVDAGCRILITTRAVNDRIKRNITNNDLLALQRVEGSDMRRLARLTGARIIPKLKYINKRTLGEGTVSVTRKAGRNMTIITSNAGERIYTLFCRAPDPRRTDSFENALESALGAVASASRDNQVVAGGGAIEMAAARTVTQRTNSTNTRAQFAEEEFSQTLITIPRTLAHNAGMDATNTITQLRVAHDEGCATMGVDAFNSNIRDMMLEQPVVEASEIKKAIWKAATELAVQLLRIDDRLNANCLRRDDEDRN